MAELLQRLERPLDDSASPDSLWMVLVDGLSQRDIARRLGHSRNSVVKALQSAVQSDGMPSRRRGGDCRFRLRTDCS
ncbi:hypothetical protein [Stieleria varia]|uniref:Uncharacterized protein n=1 Tax=Stieleria varia TaxID=2528005 RepID=A0A5C6A1P4_9BACT|nr:hypothetical protein [Stieleria varia]TWT93772.1 hypothetical protein Pla52n_56000 [Stieleria varia]